MKKCISLKKRILTVACITVMAIGMVFNINAGFKGFNTIDINLSENEGLARSERVCFYFTAYWPTWGKCVVRSETVQECIEIEEGEGANCDGDKLIN